MIKKCTWGGGFKMMLKCYQLDLKMHRHREGGNTPTHRKRRFKSMGRGDPSHSLCYIHSGGRVSPSSLYFCNDAFRGEGCLKSEPLIPQCTYLGTAECAERLNLIGCQVPWAKSTHGALCSKPYSRNYTQKHAQGTMLKNILTEPRPGLNFAGT